MQKYPDYKYPDRIDIKNRQWPDKIITKPPIWCSVDLRDGNQALPVPMNPEQKANYFEMLCGIGFKEIEVSFPSASKDDFDFVRQLIDKKLIPDDVTISVLTQARKHLIEKTVESLVGSKRAIFHCYLATSDLHSKIVFNKNRNEVMDMAVEGTRYALDCIEKAGIRETTSYEFSPEEFTDSNLEFVIELCEKLRNVWKPRFKGDFILNLPATVERRPPNQYADMIEYFCGNYKYRDETVISLHAHNDQGCAVAATEFALLAGADRVEGTLFGHGERTGNVDLITFALNLHSRGINTGLDFSRLPQVTSTVEKISGIDVHPRHPYAGNLVFTAFSGSHQDAIRKGMKSIEQSSDFFRINWKVPYLHINPKDVGRSYEQLIRINSQSGKGGIAYILERDFNISVPHIMHQKLGEAVQSVADKKGAELTAQEIYEIFEDNFIRNDGPYKFIFMQRTNQEANTIQDSIKLEININGTIENLYGKGNGPISAVVHALQSSDKVQPFMLEYYQEQAIGSGEDATALAYISIKRKSDGCVFHGAGKDCNIDWAAVKALLSALNKSTNQ